MWKMVFVSLLGVHSFINVAPKLHITCNVGDWIQKPQQRTCRFW
jgi:hypothetical protein